MRNIPKPLPPDVADLTDELATQLQLLKADDAVVGIRYARRDGSPGSVKGKVKFINGKPGFDTHSVTIEDSSKGFRTINLCNVKTILV